MSCGTACNIYEGDLTVIKSCCFESCLDIDLDKLDSVIYGSKVKLSEINDEILKKLYYGYTCEPEAYDKFEKLNKYMEIMQDYWEKLYYGACPCLRICDIQYIIEKALTIIGMNCDTLPRKDVIVNNENEEEWIAKNPYCVSKADWERLTTRICDTIDLRFDIQEQKELACDITFDIVRNQISCDVLTAIDFYVEACDKGLKVSRTDEECEYDFKLLLEKVPECNIDLKLYKELVDCYNMSFDIIESICSSGLSIDIDREKDCPVIKTQLNSYDITCLAADIKATRSDYEFLEQLGINVESSESLYDKKEYFRKLSSDYKK